MVARDRHREEETKLKRMIRRDPGDGLGHPLISSLYICTGGVEIPGVDAPGDILASLGRTVIMAFFMWLILITCSHTSWLSYVHSPAPQFQFSCPIQGGCWTYYTAGGSPIPC